MQQRWAQKRGDSDAALPLSEPTLPPHPVLFSDLAPSSLTDRQLVEAVIVQSANPPRTTWHMIQATWNFHVLMYGREVGYRVWRRSLEEICQLGREECATADKSTLEVL
jgi:hypothetical protein